MRRHAQVAKPGLVATDLLSQEAAAALAQHRWAGQRQAHQALPSQPPQHQLHRLALEQVRSVEAAVMTGRPPHDPPGGDRPQ